jgi:hypothetical protein
MSQRHQEVTIGDRVFKVGPITLGTARRAPDAFRIAMAMKPDANVKTMPTPEEFGALVTLLHDGINTASPNTISLDELNTLVDELQIMEGVTQLTDAIRTMTRLSMNGTAKAGETSGGNGNGSKVTTSPTSSD